MQPTNCLPYNKNADFSKLKAFADGNLNVAIVTEFVSDMVENILGKEKLAAFSLYATMFSKGFYLWVNKTWNCMVKSTGLQIQVNL